MNGSHRHPVAVLGNTVICCCCRTGDRYNRSLSAVVLAIPILTRDDDGAFTVCSIFFSQHFNYQSLILIFDVSTHSLLGDKIILWIEAPQTMILVLGLNYR